LGIRAYTTRIRDRQRKAPRASVRHEQQPRRQPRARVGRTALQPLPRALFVLMGQGFGPFPHTSLPNRGHDACSGLVAGILTRPTSHPPATRAAARNTNNMGNPAL